ALVTDANGCVAHRAAYMPYGSDRGGLSYPTGCESESFTPKYQFNFKEKEQDGTGFYDYGARIFNPATGRWLSPDTGTNDGQNRYEYVSNNPLKYTDPTGHCTNGNEADCKKSVGPPPQRNWRKKFKDFWTGLSLSQAYVPQESIATLYAFGD